MNEETLLEQMTRVRPEMLNENALKLFNKIMEVIDERDKLQQEIELLNQCIKTDKDKIDYWVDKCEELQQENQRLKEAVDGLCQENTELKEQIKIYEDPDDLTLMFMWCDEKAKDKIKELQQRIEKAIEFTTLRFNKDNHLSCGSVARLLSILKGEEK